MNNNYLDSLGVKELLFLFFNIKGLDQEKEICKKGSDIPNQIIAETRISNTAKLKDKFTFDDFDDNYRDEIISRLNEYYDFDEKFIAKGNNSIIITFAGNGLSLSELLNNIYSKILVKSINTSTDDFSKFFVLSAFGFRGSIDFTRNYLTIDLHQSRISTKKDVDNLFKIIVMTNLDEQLNLNFRELQGERTKRATQFRINLKYVYDNYLYDLKLVNPYRFMQLNLNSDYINTKSISKSFTKFIERVEFYIKNIVGENISDDSIKDFRDQLKFEDNNTSNVRKRNSSVKRVADMVKPNKCVGCCDQYNIKDRSFKKKGMDKWYLELHHVISFANEDINTEILDNYVKLCPTCHRALTPNRANEEYQKEIISNILKNDNGARKFVEGLKEEKNYKGNIEEFVYDHLR